MLHASPDELASPKEFLPRVIDMLQQEVTLANPSGDICDNTLQVFQSEAFYSPYRRHHDISECVSQIHISQQSPQDIERLLSVSAANG